MLLSGLDYFILCVQPSIAKVRPSSQTASVSRCVSGRGLQVCQSYPLLPLSPCIANQSQQPAGMYQGCEAKNSQCCQRPPAAQQGPPFLVYVTPPASTACFPSYALMPAKEPKPALLWICCGDQRECWLLTLMLLRTGSTL